MIYAYMAALIAAAGGAFLRSEYEKNHLATDHYQIISPKIKEGKREFVFLSDLHNKEFGKKNRQLIGEIDRIRPDAVLIGGDMMVSKAAVNLEVPLTLVKELASRYPVYYANGNHEDRMRCETAIYGELYEKFKKEMSDAGVICLSDESAGFGKDIRITGCNMDRKYYRHRYTVPVLPENELECHVGKADASKFQILLLHSPLFFKSSRQWGADLTLSGHFHGGTIRLPLLGGVMTPQYQFFYPRCAGRFDKEGKTMIVSRGLGTHSINIRLNNRPQLIWLTLTR